MTGYTAHDVLEYENTDVSWELARQAHAGTSFVPEQRANQECNGYLSQMAGVAETFARFADDENIEDLRADLEAYRIEYAKRTEHHWRARAGCVSTMIAGGSGFNVARAEKANIREHKALQSLLDWRAKALDRLHARYNPRRIAAQPIRSDDDDAISKLHRKVEEAEWTQQRMKAANRVCRSSKTGEEYKREALGKLGYSATVIDGLLNPDWGAPGFAAYQLSNNNANIRRMKERIAALEREAARPEAEDRQASILGTPVVIVENTDEQRIQLVFDGKPPDAVIDLLKSRGFNWARSQQAWQRLLNDNARAAVQWMTEVTG